MSSEVGRNSFASISSASTDSTPRCQPALTRMARRKKRSTGTSSSSTWTMMSQVKIAPQNKTKLSRPGESVHKSPEKNKKVVKAVLERLMQRQYLESISLHTLTSEVVHLVRMYLTHKEIDHTNTLQSLLELLGPDARKKFHKRNQDGPKINPYALADVHRAHTEANGEISELIYTHLEAKFQKKLMGVNQLYQRAKRQIEELKKANVELNVGYERYENENLDLRDRIKWWKDNCGKVREEFATPRVSSSTTGSPRISSILKQDADALGSNVIQTQNEQEKKERRAPETGRLQDEATNRSNVHNSAQYAKEINKKEKTIKELKAELYKQKYNLRATTQRLASAENEIASLRKTLQAQRRRSVHWK
mmetsp:Transcript_25411/g.45159  ORF Transcript_25411/g.45159 Transcript_25411/m.45159 type:complete len:365 (-) Transcript_25411:183-1277(-)